MMVDEDYDDKEHQEDKEDTSHDIYWRYINLSR